MANKPSRAAAQPGSEDAGEDVVDVAALRAELDALKGTNQSLQGQLGSERTARLNAEQAQMSEVERRLFSDEQNADSQVTALQAEIAATKRDLVTANRDGEYETAGDLTVKLGQLGSDLSDMGRRKTWISQQRERAKNDRESRATNQPSAGPVLADGTPMEAFEGQPLVKNLLSRYPQAYTDINFMLTARAAHDAATRADKLEMTSPAYAAKIEEAIKAAGYGEGGTSPGRTAAKEIEIEDEELDDTAGTRATSTSPYSETGASDDLYSVERPQPRAAAPGASRPSRTPAASTRGGNKRQPNLTKDQQSAADDLYGYLPPVERYTRYATNKEIMEGVGRRSGRPN